MGWFFDSFDNPTSCLACSRVAVELRPLRGFDIQAKWRKRPDHWSELGSNAIFIKPMKVVWSQRGLSTSIRAASPMLMPRSAALACTTLVSRPSRSFLLLWFRFLFIRIGIFLCLPAWQLEQVWQPVLLHSSPLSLPQTPLYFNQILLLLQLSFLVSEI